MKKGNIFYPSKLSEIPAREFLKLKNWPGDHPERI